MNIEFVDPVLPSRKAWMCVLGLGAVAAVLFAAGQIMQARMTAIENEGRAHASTTVVLPAPHSVPPAYAEDVKRALDRAALPEAALLRELETVAVVGIQLTAIDLDATSHVATVELRADDEKALGDYLDRLNAGQPAPVWHIERLSSSQSAAQPTSNLPIEPGRSTESVRLVRRF